MAKGKNKYILRFRIKGRGRDIHIWERFAPDWTTALKSANKALKKEYPTGYTIVSLLRAWK